VVKVSPLKDSPLLCPCSVVSRTISSRTKLFIHPCLWIIVSQNVNDPIFIVPSLLTHLKYKIQDTLCNSSQVLVKYN